MKKGKYKAKKLENTRMLTFYYKEADWMGFRLNAEHGTKWNEFCQKLAKARPDKPYPTKEDKEEFLTKLEKNEV